MQTWHIHITGQVQGVGFRPFLFLLAHQFHLKGWVNNDVDGVHIEFNATQQLATSFLNNILDKVPPLAQITTHKIFEVPSKEFADFEIKQSLATGSPNLLLTPDAGICTDCSSELFQVKNRRYHYPFITCTNCGPRYSIMQSIPYDREYTTMDYFEMCPTCRAEYENANDRRYYSQTNSCPSCSINLTLFECNPQAGGSGFNKLIGTPLFITEDFIKQIVQFWQKGKIIAIKGIGGYLLTCDARNDTVVHQLRERKYRPSKPFAIMYPNLELLKKDLELEKEGRNLLTSSAAPVVLFKKKIADTLALSVAPKLNQVGAMLPYTPLYQLLLNQFKQPIVATSGNRSNSPIVFDSEKAIEELSSIADFIVSNNRKIVVPQDDSVVKFSPFYQQKIILRRSRGYAPTYIQADLKWSSKTVLAMGAMLKSTFSLTHQGNIFISQYLGDLENFDTQENYKHTLNHFLKLLRTQPEVILLDSHPQYASSLYGKEFANHLNLSSHNIQHHQAHFAAILGEYNLIATKIPILGVIWDGAGLGEDGHIWGGEFFVYQKYQFQRRHHFAYMDVILGDKMAKEPRVSARSFCKDLKIAIPFLKEKFTPTEWTIYNKLLAKGSTLKTSSVGRLFDAVASLLGILDKQTYEGEAALLLETTATDYFKKNGLNTQFDSFAEKKATFSITTQKLLNLLFANIAKGKSTAYMAAHFHFLLVKYIEQIAITQRIKKIAFSGGVFQNGLLVDLLHYYLGKNYDLFFHQQISPNDENISFGQLVAYQIRNARKIR